MTSGPHTKDPRGGWRAGKSMKPYTGRLIRREVKRWLNHPCKRTDRLMGGEHD